jgi:hypothetical protein
MQLNMRSELVTWERFQALARALALSIQRAGYHPELIVAIGRGGYMPARIVSDYLDVFDLVDIKIEHYHGMQKERNARVKYPLIADIAGRRVLLIDDVSDTGDTFQVAMCHLREHGGPAEIRTGVLHHKTVSSFKPDFFAEEVHEWRWIVYPWAVMEDLRGFLREMVPPPASVADFMLWLHEHQGIDVPRQTLEDVFMLRRSEAERRP